MIKKLAKIFLCSFLVFSCSNNQRIVVKTDLEELRLKGKIKKIEKSAWEVEMSFGELIKVKPKIGLTIEPYGFYHEYFRELHFNQEGNISKSIMLDENNIITSTVNNFYDNYGRIIKKLTGKGDTEITSYDDINFVSKTYLKYLNQISPWEETRLSYYDINNNIIKEEYFTDNKLNSRYFMQIDDNGKVYLKEGYVNRRNENVKGNLTSLKLYGYNYEGNLISSFDSISPVKSFESSLILYDYNKQGDVISYYYPRGYSYYKPFYTYKYDQKNNWIERIEYIFNQPSVLTIREIEYY